MQCYLSFNAEGWKGQVLAGWEDVFTGFDGWLASSVDECVVNLPSRKVWRSDTPKGALFVKVIYRASEAQGPARQAFASLKWMLRPSRARAILRVSKAMLDAGFECPVPVLAVRRRSATGWPTDVFVSAECRDTNLCDQLPALPREEIKALLARVAIELNRFHRAGFVHGDCIPANLAMNAQGRLVFFDNDRTVRYSWLRERYAQRRNLIQLGYRLTRQLGDISYFERFLYAYIEAAEVASADFRDMQDILQAVRKRLSTAP